MLRAIDLFCRAVTALMAVALMIMVALVLGELLQLRWSRRIALLVLGCGWVFVCNVFRATALVFVAANSGLEALDAGTIGSGPLPCFAAWRECSD